KYSLVSPAAGETLSNIVKEWQQELLNHLRPVSPAPKVSKSSLRDARKLFGDNFKTKVTLRKSDDLEACEEISLLQFDPNFTSSEVICRHPSCSTKNSEAAKSGTKRDLFLCPIHQQVLRDSISDVLAKEEIKLSTSTEKPKHVGAILGAGAFFLGPWGGVIGVAIGGTTGGFIGNGILSLITGGQRNQELQ
ncbi:unnamed protein product, partial [Pocillopora meandrina]